MKHIGAAIAACLAMVWCLNAASAAEMPAMTVKQQGVSGIQGLPLPAAKSRAAGEIVVAQRGGRRGGVRRGGGRRVGGGRRRGSRGRKIGAGLAIGAAILGAAILSSQGARADDDREYRHRQRCRRWHRQCRRGNDWACEKLDNRC